MPKRRYEWRVDAHGCYKFDNALLGLGPRDQSAHLPVFLHLRNTKLPGPSSIMRSEQAQQRTCAETTYIYQAFTNMTIREENAHDCAPVFQGLLSVFFPTLLRSRVTLLLVCCSLHLH